MQCSKAIILGVLSDKRVKAPVLIMIKSNKSVITNTKNQNVNQKGC